MLSAEHKISKKSVAVKVIMKNKIVERQIYQAHIEIETLKVCHHPNIMRLYEVFESADNIFMVLEYLNGGNLFTYLKEHGFIIKESMARKFISSIAHAIHYMHTYGIIHRDIKPDNIVLVNEKENTDVKIVDFGLARLLGPNELASEPVGTLCYAAPEILKGELYNNSVDMWSLGVIAHLMLTGNFPFDSELTEDELTE